MDKRGYISYRNIYRGKVGSPFYHSRFKRGSEPSTWL